MTTSAGRVGDWTVVRRLGAGGMGTVLEAERGGLRRALKVLPAGADPDMVERFRREGEAMARVDAHPNVVRVHAVEEHAGRPFLVLDLLTGGDLHARLAERGPLPPAEAASLVAALARGLAHVHARGVLHRDLKSANVLFDDQGVPRLTDFGLARLVDASTLTRTGEVLGTPAFMSPEQARGERAAIDARSDVYGLGAVLYEALTGRPPFDGTSWLAVLGRVLETLPQPPSVRRPGVPPGLEAICLRALAKRPEQRPQSAAALADELEAWLRAPEAGRARRRLWIGGGVVAVGLTAALGLLLAAPSSPPPAPGPAAPTGPTTVPTTPAPPPPAKATEDAPAAPPPIERRIPRELADFASDNPWDVARIANAYADGSEGVRPDPEQALAWHQLSADLGNAASCVWLGQRTADPAQAFALFDKAAELGDVDGLALKGAALCEGRGVARDAEGGLLLLSDGIETRSFLALNLAMQFVQQQPALVTPTVEQRLDVLTSKRASAALLLARLLRVRGDLARAEEYARDALERPEEFPSGRHLHRGARLELVELHLAGHPGVGEAEAQGLLEQFEPGDSPAVDDLRRRWAQRGRR